MSIFVYFHRFYKVFRISPLPPQTLDFGGAILPPEFALFFDVYRGFQDFPPPDIGFRIIHHDAQYLVLLRVFKPFPGFPPPRHRHPHNSP